MATVQRVAQVIGWIFIIVGIMGFFATGTSMDANVETAPRLFGLFPLNLLHNFVHLGFGIWGIAAARAWSSAKTYCQVAGVIYLVLAVLGFITPSGFGIIPIGSHDIWLHAGLGIVLTYFGFTAREAPAERQMPGV